ncbi:flavin reductase [Streptomyces varsoviensis]|uniref:MFS transporter n=1 Tax=Streptomyces varsoviensis TaxID=67373 RepID=A0ABR5J1H6_9ACTN|nr:flavin reductase [Streptomyces varsoviensis]KOG87234.1 MFS transporter [Streptomyces varsoviensis]
MTTSTADRVEFRDAMARLAAAVNILTTDGPAGRCGITLSAVCSVTDTPPTVLACVNRNSAMHDVFVRNGRVALNVLGGGQAELARHFSGATKVAMEERFAWDVWEPTAQVPVLRDAPVTMTGVLRQQTPMGSHSVLFIGVEEIRVRRDGGGDGLVYHNRDFHRLGA